MLTVFPLGLLLSMSFQHFSSSPPPLPLCLFPTLCSPPPAGLAQRHPADPAASSLAAAHAHLGPACHRHPGLHEQRAAARQLEVNHGAFCLATAAGQALNVDV